MGFLNTAGVGANTFGQNMLNTFLALQENDRAKQLMAQKEAQFQQEQEMLAKMKAESQGFMNNPVAGEVQPPVPQMQGNFQNSGLPALGDQGLLSQPTQQNYASMFEKIKSEGGNPDRELFDRQARIGMAYDPAKFMPLVGRQETAQDKILNAMMIAQLNNQTKKDVSTDHNVTWKDVVGMQTDTQRSNNAANNNMRLALEQIRDGKRGVSGGGTDEKLKTQTVKEIQSHIDKNYTPVISQLEKKKNSPYGLKPEEIQTLNDFYKERAKAINTIAQVRQGTLAPSNINWSGNQSAINQTPSTNVIRYDAKGNRI